MLFLFLLYLFYILSLCFLYAHISLLYPIVDAPEAAATNLDILYKWCACSLLVERVLFYWGQTGRSIIAYVSQVDWTIHLRLTTIPPETLSLSSSSTSTKGLDTFQGDDSRGMR